VIDGAHQGLLDRADRALGGRPVTEVLAQVRAIIGVPKAPETETAAQAALDKLRSFQRPTEEELDALERVIRMMRPAPLSRKGALDGLPSGPGANLYNPKTVKLWEDFRESVRPYLYSIGRLDRATGSNRKKGTGFLVAPDLVLTNKHVLEALTQDGRLREGQAVIRFHQELGSPDPPPGYIPLAGVVATHPTLDMALLRIEPDQSRPVPPLGTGLATPAAEVAAIGYPFKDPGSPLFAEAIFNGEYGVKRAALGEVIEATEIRMAHDCSTLGGNSGSPIFSLQSGKVVAIHYSGNFMYRNKAIPASEIAGFVSGARNA
jgi:S1-C subfamily serine protease